MLDQYCNGCDHRVTLGPSTACCNYLLDTGERRPCHSGYGCVCHTNPPKEKEDGRLPMWDTALAYSMFRNGKTDKEIGLAVGRSKSTIQRWRLQNNLLHREERWRRNYRQER